MIKWFSLKRRDSKWEKGPEAQPRYLDTPHSKLAVDLVARWGLVSAMPDGEDSAGRQRTRLQTPEELVARACETADKLLAACVERGWFIPVPEELYAVEKNDDTKSA